MKNDLKHSNHIHRLLEERHNQDIETQISEATQLINEIESIDSKTAYAKVSKQIQSSQRVTYFITILTRIAAVLFIPALISSIIIYNLRQTPVVSLPFAMQEISTPPGVRSKVVLPDGSTVWLNSESTLKFRVPFDSFSRDVSLKGEAFFDVKKNPDAPFMVFSGSAQVKVYGTRFNCKAFAEEDKIEVVLEEGKISLNSGGVEKMIEKVLKPGDRAVIDKADSQTKITNEKIEKYIAWHQGKLVFDETPMQEVAVQLARWYGVEVAIDDPKILKYKITTTFDNESLNQVLELLRISSPIEIQYLPATIDHTTKEQTKSKVIFTGKIL
jgi:ferric-dicitrate binding protein FerR (iron transport regulator)